MESSDVHLSRVENTAGSGISDVTACHAGVEVWIELKVMHGNNLHFRNSQRSWIVRRTDVGGRVLVIVRWDDCLVIWKGRDAVLAPSTSITGKKAFYVKQSDLPVPLYACNKPFNWKEIKQAIFYAN